MRLLTKPTANLRQPLVLTLLVLLLHAARSISAGSAFHNAATSFSLTDNDGDDTSSGLPPNSLHPLSAASASAPSPPPSVHFERIPNSTNYRVSTKKSALTNDHPPAAADHRPWGGYGRIDDAPHCVRPVKRCEPLANATCFGWRLPYSLTSPELTDSFRQSEIRDRLQMFTALRSLPKCWAVVQPFLCAVFVPRCERIGHQDWVHLPSLEMCRIVQEPCRALYSSGEFFPRFLRCNETLFPAKCNNDAMREGKKFNTSGECARPLVATESAESYYADVEGCGLQCADPLYTEDEHRQVHNLVFWCAAVCWGTSAFSVLTFLIEWRTANKYPSKIIFYMNVCFIVCCTAWLSQFGPGNREDIVCRKDGTLRKAELSPGENLSCIAVFSAVYYSLVAAMIWFVIFTYSWHLRALGNVERLAKKSSYFHGVAWVLPIVATLTTIGMREVDGNSVAGICFVGYVNEAMRAGFLLGPLAGVLVLGGGFIGRGMVTLVPLRRFSAARSLSASKKIGDIIWRMAVTAGSVGVCICVVMLCQVYEIRSKTLWAESLRRYIVCKIAGSHSPDSSAACRMEHRPSLAVRQLQLLCLFAIGVIMSSWCWTRQTAAAWRRYLGKKFGRQPDANEAAEAQGALKQKHKIIAQTYAKRKEFQDTGRLSVSFFEPRTDPAGLNFDINDLHSAATNEMSSTWCNYLPKITRRRSAIANSISCAAAAGGGGGGGGSSVIGGGAIDYRGSQSAMRKSSVDSEISVSVRQYSVESRRNSMDSQVSVKIAEVQTKVACRSTHGLNRKKSGGGGRHQHTTKRFAQQQQHHRQHYNRRGSSTSVESHIITSSSHHHQQQQHHHHHQQPSHNSSKNMRRRSANVGLVNAADIAALFRQFPQMAQNFQGLSTSSEAEQQATAAAAATVGQQAEVSQQHGGDYDDDEAGGEDSVLLGLHRQQYVRSAAKSRHTVDAAAANSSSREGGGRHSKNSQRSGPAAASASAAAANNSNCVATLRVPHRSGSRKAAGSKRRQKLAAKAAKQAANSQQQQKQQQLQQMALIEPHRLLAAPYSSSATSTASTSSSTSSFNPYSADFPLGLLLAGGTQHAHNQQQPPLNSSYSDGRSGKHSRTSKTSCDVGTQANAGEIAEMTTTTTTSAAAMIGGGGGGKKAAGLMMQQQQQTQQQQHAQYVGNGHQHHVATTTTTTTHQLAAMQLHQQQQPPPFGACISSPPPPSSATSMLMAIGGGGVGVAAAPGGGSMRRAGGAGGLSRRPGAMGEMSEADTLRMLLLPSK